MADADLGSDVLALDGQPLVVEDTHAAAAPDHHAHVAHVLPLGPGAGVVDQERVELLDRDRVLQRADLLLGPDVAEAEHVGLPEQDEHLHLLAHVRRLAVGIGQLLLLLGAGLLRRQLGAAGEGDGQQTVEGEQDSLGHGIFSARGRVG